MSSNDTWMPLYIGDYLADTMHLTNAEHGSYLLLIMHYWRSGPLPDDDKQLAAIARTDRRDWPEMAKTMRAFFRASSGKLYHKRIDNELAMAQVNVEQRRAAGRASAEARARQRALNGHGNGGPNGSGNGNHNEPSNENPTSVATGGSTDRLRKANSSPSPSPSPLPSPLPSPKGLLPSEAWPTSVGRSPNFERDFDEFWQAYPRKVAKGAARKVWPRAIAKTNLAAMLRAIASQRWDPDERYQPHPATWLNAERWLDQADAFDPVLRAAGLSPEDFDLPTGLIQ